MALAEPRLSPSEPTRNPEIRRADYEWSSPQARKAVAEETIIALSECALSLRFLDLSDPEDVDNFREVIGQSREFDSFKALERIKKLVQEYLKEKVLPWED
jgi:hypothetical protein